MRFLHPRYWLTYFGILVAYLVIQITPYRLLLAFGAFLGRMGYLISKRRRTIARRNISVCLSHFGEAEQQQILIDCFANVGRGLIEMLCAWWLPTWRLMRIPFEFNMPNGSISNRSKGVMLCGAHFTPMEMVGCQFGLRHHKAYLVYQKHKDPVINAIINRGRKRYTKGLIDRKDIRSMIRVMRNGDILWYAPDQDLQRSVSVFVPFFGVETATVRATGLLLKAGRSDCYLTSFYRAKNRYVVNLILHEALPTGNDISDALIYTKNLEKEILANPSQYLWLHRRFKTRPEGEASFYDF